MIIARGCINRSWAVSFSPIRNSSKLAITIFTAIVTMIPSTKVTRPDCIGASPIRN
jgi:hypothetical protein